MALPTIPGALKEYRVKSLPHDDVIFIIYGRREEEN